MSEAELKTLIIKQLESPLRPEDRADVIMRAIQAQKAKWEREAKLKLTSDILSSNFYTTDGGVHNWNDENIRKQLQALYAELSKEQS